MLLARAHNYRLHNLALLDGSIGRSFLDCGGDDVAQAGLLAQPPPSGRITCSLRAPELSATASMVLICTAMILLLTRLPYLAASTWFTVAVSSSWLSVERRTISSSDHRFSLLSGRVSRMRTTSPTRAEFCSSCA